MRDRLAGLLPFVFAVLLVHCSLVVDTDGLSGGKSGGATDASTTDASRAEGGGEVDSATGPAPLALPWLAYGTTTGDVRVRPWLDASGAWNVEETVVALGDAAVRWVLPKETPVGSFVAVVSQTTASAKLDVYQRQADATWKLGFSQPMALATRRAFDIEYETNAHGVVVAYGDATAQVKIRRFTAAGGWGAELALKGAGTLPPQWIELARNPRSDEIALTYVDDGSNLDIAFWDGATWTEPAYLDANINTLDFKCFDVAYENSTGVPLVAWGHYANKHGYLGYRTRVNGKFTESKIAIDGDVPGPVVLTPEIGSRRIAVATVEYACNRNGDPCDDFYAFVWDGTDLASSHAIDGDTTTIYANRPSTSIVGAAWSGATGTAIAAYHRTFEDRPGQLAYARFAGGAWTDALTAAAPPDLAARASLQLVSGPKGKVIAVVEDVNGSLWSKQYSGDATGTWSSVASDRPAENPLSSSLVISNGVPFGLAEP